MVKLNIMCVKHPSCYLIPNKIELCQMQCTGREKCHRYNTEGWFEYNVFNPCFINQRIFVIVFNLDYITNHTIRYLDINHT